VGKDEGIKDQANPWESILSDTLSGSLRLSLRLFLIQKKTDKEEAGETKTKGRRGRRPKRRNTRRYTDTDQVALALALALALEPGTWNLELGT
jgi:hypothetical protein